MSGFSVGVNGASGGVGRCTDTNGEFILPVELDSLYTLSIGSPGTNDPQHTDCTDVDYVTRWYQAGGGTVTNEFLSDPIEVVSGSPNVSVGDITYPLAGGAFVRGTIYEVAAPDIIDSEFFWISIDRVIGENETENVGGLGWQGDDPNKDGKFNLELPAGTYHIHADANLHLHEFYNEVSSREQATPVVLTVGNPVENIDFTLDPGLEQQYLNEPQGRIDPIPSVELMWWHNDDGIETYTANLYRNGTPEPSLLC